MRSGLCRTKPVLQIVSEQMISTLSVIIPVNSSSATARNIISHSAQHHSQKKSTHLMLQVSSVEQQGQEVFIVRGVQGHCRQQAPTRCSTVQDEPANDNVGRPQSPKHRPDILQQVLVRESPLAQ